MDAIASAAASAPGATARTGFVAIVGRPNVGKSTLLNAFLGTKLAIVSRRAQTTRNRILGVVTRGDDQVIVIDTPGIHRGRDPLNRFMVQQALDSLAGVDCVVLVTEIQPDHLARVVDSEARAASLHDDDRFVLDRIRLEGPRQAPTPSPPMIVAINKIDLLRDRRHLLPLIAGWSEAGFERIVPISALNRVGVEALFEEARGLLPAGPHLYPEEMYTDCAERFLAAELIREQVYHRCRQELPYASAVEIESFEERSGRGDVVITAVIHVERAGQKGILIGKRGAMIKQIGIAARKEIARLLGCDVHLKLSVKIQTDWTRSPAARQRFGYE